LARGNTGSLVKTNNTFIGWNTQANGSGLSYATGVVFSMGASNVTLFAQWTANPTYTVTYNGNGNSGGTIPVDINSYLTGATVTVLGNAGTPVKTGSTFVGWNTQSNGSGVSYAIGATFPMGFANVNLFAQWTSNPTYTIAYVGNGSTSGTAPTDKNSYLTGATVTVLANTGSLALSRTGYAFTGWDTVAAGNGAHFGVGATFKMASANDTLFAQWTPTFTVTYNGNNNTGGNVPKDYNTYLPATTVTVLGNTGSLVKVGYAFTGWDTVAAGNGAHFAVGATFSMGSANVTLYAQWTIIPTFTVTYNANQATGGSAPVDNNLYVFGQSVKVLGNLQSLVKTGFTFVGWNTLTNGQGISYSPGVSFTMGSSNDTLYAQWTASPTYTLTYNGNGGIGAQTDPNQYLAGSPVTVRGQGNLQNIGYTFSGWDTIAAGNGTHYAVGAIFIMGSANVTLYAQWTIFSAPTLVSPAIGATNQSINPTLSWSAVSGATSYEVQVSTISSFSNIVKDTTVTILSLTIGPFSNGATYYWQVRAKNTGGISAWSSIWNFTTIVAASGTPTLSSPANGATNQSINPTLSWNSVTGAATYEVQVSMASNFATTIKDTTLTGTTLTIGPLSNSTLYYWQVRANNTGGSSAWSTIWNFTTIVAASGTPTLSSPANGATNQFINPSLSLSWNSVTGALTYRLQVSTAPDFSSGIAYDDSTRTTNLQAISGLSNNTTYYWRVRAKNTGGVSAYSSTWIFTTVIAAPPAPTPSLPVNNATNQSINPTFTWSASSSAATYEVQVSATNSFASPLKDTTLNGTILTLPFSLSNSTPYYWHVRAQNVGGASAYSSTWNFMTIIAAPPVPVLSSPLNIATNQSINPTFTWIAASTALTYEVQVATASSFSSISMTKDTTLTGTGITSLTLPFSLTNSTTYYWHVLAKNDGGLSAYSSPAWSFTTVLATPTITSPSTSVLQPANPIFKCSPVIGATRYRVQLSFSSAIIKDTTQLNDSLVIPLTSSGTYSWQVQALNTNNNDTSAWSTTSSFTADITLPTVSSISPSNGDKDVSPTGPFTATFSEAMNPATINGTTNFTLQADGSTSTVSGTVSYDAINNIAIFTVPFDNPLQPGTSYTATITTGVTDLAGNAMANDFLWSFTTVAASSGSGTGSVSPTGTLRKSLPAQRAPGVH
jgi:uncharacterized repeat protein (TIGR02543 family)